MKIRILIVDDHKVFRSALRCLLEMDPAIEVVGEAGNGLEASLMVAASHAQVVCMDFRMAKMDGVESTQCLLAVIPQIKIIGLSAGYDSQTEAQMLAAGAAIFIAKERVAEDLLPAIHALMVGAVRQCQD